MALSSEGSRPAEFLTDGDRPSGGQFGGFFAADNVSTRPGICRVCTRAPRSGVKERIGGVPAVFVPDREFYVGGDFASWGTPVSKSPTDSSLPPGLMTCRTSVRGARAGLCERQSDPWNQSPWCFDQQLHPVDEPLSVCKSLPDFRKGRAGIKAVLIVLPESPHVIKLENPFIFQ